MDIIKKYKPEHYDSYQKKITKIVGEHRDINTWLRHLGLSDMMIWLKTLLNTKKDHPLYLEENFIFITLIIRLFVLELDIDENKIKLSNDEILKLIQRFEHSINTEYAYRTNVIDDRDKHTLLVDVEIKKGE